MISMGLPHGIVGVEPTSLDEPVVQMQCPVRVYRDAAGGVVIHQDPVAMYAEEATVFLASDAAAKAIAKAILQLIGEPSE